MLYILGAGSAHPDNVINNDFLKEIGDDSEALTELLTVSGIKERRTTLSLDYLRETANREPFGVHRYANEGPTDLSYKAALQALKAAGIEATDLGLLIGDCSTPIETCPSESQHLGGALGIKVPAYDIPASSVALLLQLNILSAWKPERIPDYVLLVSSNVPTHSVNYASGPERVYFGDGATALVVSAKHPGRLSVKNSYYGNEPEKCDLIKFDAYGHVSMQDEYILEAVEKPVEKVLSKAIQDNNLKSGTFAFIGPQTDLSVIKSLSDKFDIPETSLWYNLNNYGDSLGAGAFSVLADKWESLSSTEEVLIAVSGVGGAYGYALLSVE
ncbi:MAG: hypothetical protein D6719_12095 [Candidatus Dadabacteria bacterium]|nr:MAG: hypothetical protein D6719_12095 [Candidatus Dadabacteria bacterium]